MRTLLFSFFFLLFFTGLSQSSKKFDLAFLEGISLLKKNDYLSAEKVFHQLRSTYPQNYSHTTRFFYALCLYKNGKQELAQKILLVNIIQKNPSFKKMDDTYYLLTRIEIRKENFSQAFSYLQSIKKKSQYKDFSKLEKYCIVSMSFDDLQSTFRAYPTIKEVSKELLERCYITTKEEENNDTILTLIEELQKKVSNWKALKEKLTPQFVKKDVYHIGVLMPFFHQEKDSLEKERDFVLDIFQGLEIACNHLREEGIKIELHAFDNLQKETFTQEIINEATFISNIDVLIGPIYRNSLEPVKKFSQQYHTYTFNPITSNSLYIKDNKFAFMTLPSYETQVKQLARFAIEKLNRPQVYIFYDLTHPKDTTLAIAYKNAIEELGGQVEKMIPFIQNDRKWMMNNMTIIDTSFRDSTQLDIKTHLFFSTSTHLSSMNVLGLANLLELKMPIMVLDPWLKLPQADYQVIERSNMYIASPIIHKKQTPEFTHFSKVFFENIQKYPSQYALLAYDIMTFLGKGLSLYGVNLKEWIYTLPVPFKGVGVEKIIYEKGNNDNQYVPIYHFENGKMVLVNQYE